MIAPHRMVGRWLDVARASMPPEQRWTSGVALLLALAVLLFGHPLLPVHLAAPRPAAAPPSREVAAAAVAARPQVSPWSIALGASPAVPQAAAAGPGSADLSSASGAAPAAPMRIVALVAPGGTQGRDDRAAAELFLSMSQLGAEIVVMDRPASALCEAVAGADVAVASFGLPEDLRSCLEAQGVFTLSFDSATLDAGVGLSTRLPAEAALGDLVHWGVSSPVLRGRVGVVTTAPLRGVVEGSVVSWREAGLDVGAVTYLEDGARVPPTAEVRRFIAEGIDVVLFALPSGAASGWAVQHSLLDPPVRYVIGDVFDALWSESYAPVLDGAVTLTSLRVPWYSREHGETETQSACREAWEAEVVPPVLSPGRETVMVYAWCQHVGLLETVLSPAELAGLAAPSPLTSDLGPLRGGGWGPQQDAALSWRASCRCWQSSEGFRSRAR